MSLLAPALVRAVKFRERSKRAPRGPRSLTKIDAAVGVKFHWFHTRALAGGEGRAHRFLEMTNGAHEDAVPVAMQQMLRARVL
jgi:hypothetical protein